LKVNKLKKIYLTSIGCKVNHYEIQLLREKLLNAKCKIVDDFRLADICIINTCTVTSKSDHKSKKIIQKISKKNPTSIIAAIGCCVNNEFSCTRGMDGVSFFVGNKKKDTVTKMLGLKTDNEINYITDYFNRDRAFVKIQDGCDNYCSYCIVAYTRGKARSRSKEDILKEISLLTAKGFREIVLTGINIGYYGRDLGLSLRDLLNDCLKIRNLGRLRLSSLNPEDISPELIELICTNDKICDHLHISIQSGDSQILKLMNRKYNREDLLNLLDALRKKSPDMGLSGDFICGFPGEDEEMFKNTLRLVTDFDFIKTHVFTYSDRKKTAANKMKPKITDRIKKQRSAVLKNASYDSATRFLSKFKNKELNVLIEQKVDKESGLLGGYSQNYIKTLVKNATNNLRGKITRVKVSDLDNNQVVSCLI
jgi:threonylcarbamoyladenosine tRNA methylthiotransferase MtaB